MYAVDPATVRATARQLSGEQIIDELTAMSGQPEWVTISGGNPALHQLGPVVDRSARRRLPRLGRDSRVTLAGLAGHGRPPHSLTQAA